MMLGNFDLSMRILLLIPSLGIGFDNVKPYT